MSHGAMDRHHEFLRFLKQVAKAYPDREPHVVMDNYATHKSTEVRDLLDDNPRIHTTSPRHLDHG